MFAVKGWSVPTENLTSEATGASAAGTGSNSVPVKKRKRPNGKPKIAVTDENVGELWEKFVQNKKPRIEDEKKEKKEKTGGNDDKAVASAQDGTDKPLNKRQRQAKKAAERQAALEAATETAAGERQAGEDDEWDGIDEEPQAGDGQATEAAAPEAANVKKEDKKQKTKKPDAKNTTSDGDKQKKDAKQKTETAVVPSAPPKPAGPKLTPLQAAMREKLVSARFRHLNETLYTRPSAEAFDLFKTSPDMFVEYHEGFRRQVAVWPENPIDGYIADILARARVKPPRVDRQHRHQREGAAPPTGNKVPLPRARDGTCTIADLGCGDGKLGSTLQPQARKLQLDVRSFDLQTDGNPMIMAADMANLPLADGSVDVAVFCLALMGTNWVDFVEEAYRVLRWKGELWVAEIKSRFTVPGKGKKGKVVEHSVGNRRNPAAGAAAAAPVVPGPKSKAGKANKEAEAAAAETDLAIEVDGAEDKRQETDVSAFVDVLAKRGFVLRGEPSDSVDLSNRMFVKMYFVKGATPVKGKGVAAAHARDAAYKPRPAKQGKKFIEGDEVEINEAAVLKPCVYKIR
jgi:ribosomal RNA-processing protein 8